MPQKDFQIGLPICKLAVQSVMGQLADWTEHIHAISKKSYSSEEQFGDVSFSGPVPIRALPLLIAVFSPLVADQPVICTSRSQAAKSPIEITIRGIARGELRRLKHPHLPPPPPSLFWSGPRSPGYATDNGGHTCP